MFGNYGVKFEKLYMCTLYTEHKHVFWTLVALRFITSVDEKNGLNRFAACVLDEQLPVGRAWGI